VPEGSTEFLGTKPLATAGKAVEGVTSTGTPYQTFTTPPLTMYDAASGQPTNALAPRQGGVQPAQIPSPAANAVPNQTVPTPGAPGAAPPGALPPGAIQTGLAPAAEAEQKGYGTQLADFGKSLQDNAAAAQQQDYLLNQMEKESQTWRMGKWATAQGEAGAYLSAFADGLGLKGPEIDNLNQATGDFQAFRKNAIQLTTAATRQVSSRAAVQEMQMIQKALPSPDMSKGGFEQVINQLHSVNDYAQATNAAADNWRQSHNGSLANFQNYWQGGISPGAFLMMRLPPDQRQAAVQEMAKTPSGKAQLARLSDEIKFGVQNGVFQNVQPQQ
jgi:hypothetical protein